MDAGVVREDRADGIEGGSACAAGSPKSQREVRARARLGSCPTNDHRRSTGGGGLSVARYWSVARCWWAVLVGSWGA